GIQHTLTASASLTRTGMPIRLSTNAESAEEKSALAAPRAISCPDTFPTKASHAAKASIAERANHLAACPSTMGPPTDALRLVNFSGFNQLWIVGCDANRRGGPAGGPLLRPQNSA